VSYSGKKGHVQADREEQTALRAYFWKGKGCPTRENVNVLWGVVSLIPKKGSLFLEGGTDSHLWRTEASGRVDNRAKYMKGKVHQRGVERSAEGDNAVTKPTAEKVWNVFIRKTNE